MVESFASALPLHPVSPRRYPLIGHWPLIFDFLGGAERMRALGDLIKLRVTPYDVYVINHPREIEELLVDKHASFHKDFTTRLLEPILGEGLLLNEGAPWRKQRRIVQPEFTPKRVDTFVEGMAACTDGTVSRLAAMKSVELHGEMTRLTLEIAGRTLFGADAGHLAAEISDMIGHFLKHYLGFMGTTLRLPDWVPTQQNRRNARNHARLEQIVHGIIEERRTHAASGNDLLSRLLAARDEHGEPMPERLLADEVLTMLLAGHETTALLLTYALMLLGRDLRAMNEVVAELAPLAGQITAESMARLPYLDAVLKETLRLYPPAYSIGREAIEDTSLGGAAIRRGAQVWLFQWSVQRDPRFYRDPLAFRPERWLSDETVQLPRFAFFPFGGGPRVCPGAHFSLVEAKVVLAMLLSRLQVRVAGHTPPELAPSITLRPKQPIYAEITRRN